MEEMSLAELRDRLKMLQATQAKELEDKRELNLLKKNQKQEELNEKAQILSKIREQSKTEARERLVKIQAKKEAEEELKQKFREQCVVEASGRIAQKKKLKLEEE